MKKKRIVIISIGALLLIAAGVFLFCISHKEKTQVGKEPVERQLPEGMITASGLTSVGMNTEILKLDFLSTELYVEESYLSVGDEVEAGTKVFKISEETLKEAKKELSDKVTETELAYRQGAIDYEADLLEADSTYQKASISAAYAQTNYDKQEAEEKQKVKDLQEQVEQARELLEEYRKSEEEDYYRTYYQIDELYEEYYEHFQLLMSFYEKWDVEELSGEEQTGNSGAQMMTMGNQAGSGDTEKLSVYQELDELVTQEGEEYQTALENYEKAKATAKAGLKKAESDLTDLEAQLTQAQTEYEQNLIEYKAEYDTALAENEDAELIYSTTKQSLEETLEDLKDEMEEAKENQDSFLEALSDGCFYTEKAGTIVVNAVTDDTYLSGNTLVIAYSNPETVSITAQVDQDDIAQISIGEQAYVMISEYGNYEGTVTTINPVTQAESRTSVTYEVTVTLTGDVQRELTLSEQEREEGTVEAQETKSLRSYQAENAQEIYDVAVGQSDFNEQQALSDYEEAAGKLEQFDQVIVDNVIYAEEGGLITEVLVAAGDTLTQDDGLISLGSGEATITLSVEEDDLSFTKLGRAVDIVIAAFPDQTFSGRVTEIGDAQIDNNTNKTTYSVVVTIEDPGNLLYQDMTAEVTFYADQTEGDKKS